MHPRTLNYVSELPNYVSNHTSYLTKNTNFDLAHVMHTAARFVCYALAPLLPPSYLNK